jgi:hypothetical protein
VSSGGGRGTTPLTAAQQAEAASYARSLGLPDESLAFSPTGKTGYLGGDIDAVVIGPDVMPGPGLTANAQVSMRGAIAHEVVGHRGAALAGQTRGTVFLEEFQASMRASLEAPGLTGPERAGLMQDAVARILGR